MAQQRLGGISKSSYGSIESRAREYDDDDIAQGLRGTDQFESISRQISSLVFSINKNSSELERISRKIGTKDDNAQLREKIHKIQETTKSTGTNLSELFLELRNRINPSNRQQRLQFERLKDSLDSSWSRYGSIQKKVVDQMRSVSLIHNAEDIERTDTWSEEARLIEQERRKEQLQEQRIIIEDDITMAQQREERIRQIESDVMDVNQIFKDLGVMIHEQGEIIDDIESNVTSAADNVDAGNEQLGLAVKYQKSYRKKLCCLAVILLVVAGVVTLILVLTLKKNK